MRASEREAKAMNINPGITKTVALLNMHGFRTTDSGDGETHDYACDREHGYVCVVLEDPATLSAETDRLATLLIVNGVKVGPFTGENDGTTQVQGGYDACDKVATIDVSPMHDRLLVPRPCLTCKRPCAVGERIVKGDGVWCSMSCAEEDGEDWAQK